MSCLDLNASESLESASFLFSFFNFLFFCLQASVFNVESFAADSRIYTLMSSFIKSSLLSAVTYECFPIKHIGSVHSITCHNRKTNKTRTIAIAVMRAPRGALQRRNSQNHIPMLNGATTFPMVIKINATCIERPS